MNSFYRKIGFGIHPKEKIPKDPYKWAFNKIYKIQKFSWKGYILNLDFLLSFKKPFTVSKLN